MSRPSSIMIDHRMIEHRTQALATVFLTGRNNVDAIPIRELGNLNLICRILTDEDGTEMIFGVAYGGVEGPILSERWAEKWLHSYFRELKTIKKYPFPVLLLLFSMKSDEGVFSWRMEPDVSEGAPVLNLNQRFVCEKATRAGLDSILKRVKSWYGAYYDRLVQIGKRALLIDICLPRGWRSLCASSRSDFNRDPGTYWACSVTGPGQIAARSLDEITAPRATAGFYSFPLTPSSWK